MSIEGKYYDIIHLDDAELALLIRALDITQNVFDEQEEEAEAMKARLENIKYIA